MGSYSDFPSSNLTVIFIFVAFVVVIKLITKHLEMKHEQALAKVKLEASTMPPQSAEKKATQQRRSFWPILLFSSLALVLLAFVMLTFSHDAATGPIYQPTTSSSAANSSNPTARLSGEDFESALAKVKNQFSQPSDTSEDLGATSLSRLTYGDWNQDLPFAADQYPSLGSCGGPFAQLITNAIKPEVKQTPVNAEAVPPEKVASGERHVLYVNVKSLHDAGDIEFFERFRTTFEMLNPRIQLIKSAQQQHEEEASPNDSPTIKHVATFKVRIAPISQGTYPGHGFYDVNRGTITCELLTNDKENIKQTKLATYFREVLWLTDFQRFEKENPDREFIVVKSNQVEISAARAHDGIVQQIGKGFGVSSHQAEPLITSVFTQQIDRPYGTLYREAALVTVPTSLPAGYFHTNKIVKNEHGRISRLGPTLRFSFEFRLALLACLTIVAGFISNIATQGYYRVGISKTAALVCGIAVFLIILIVTINAP